MRPAFPTTVRTARLTLRPFLEEDAARVLAIQSNWAVMRMLRAATCPATLQSTRDWLAGHEGEWRGGTAYRFAVVLEGEVIGCADVDEIANGRGDLGYWLDEAAWGRGLASEAAGAVVAFAFDNLGLNGLDSGHANDNPASGKVLRKLGFRCLGEARVWSNPRAEEITQCVYALDRPEEPRPPTSP
jgi:[ribosomal protein S5]-alanine N-acetyltransferase